MRINRLEDPSGDNHADRIRRLYLDLMDELDAYRPTDPNSVVQAKQRLEDACMYHVKAYTAKQYLEHLGSKL